MDGFEVYRFYLAMKFHFTTAGYDVFKHKGRVKAIRSNYESKGLKYRMESIGRKHTKPADVVSFFLACHLYDADIFDEQSSSEALQKWRKRSEMMTRFIMDEISDVKPPIDPEKIAQMVSGGSLSYETAVALNREFKFVPDIQRDFIYHKIGDKIAKLDKFIKFDEAKFKQFIQEEYEQTA